MQKTHVCKCMKFIEMNVLFPAWINDLGDLGTSSKKALGDDKWTCATEQMTKPKGIHYVTLVSGYEAQEKPEFW